VARGIEFGVSPFAEGRRAMVDRGSLFGIPTYRWLAAHSTATVEYVAFAREAENMPEEVRGNVLPDRRVADLYRDI
jgi:hypothetical protein